MENHTLTNILIDKISRDFLDGAITFGAIAGLPNDLQMKIHARIMMLTDMYQRIDKQRKEAEPIYRSCEKSSSDRHAIYKDVVVWDEAMREELVVASVVSDAPLGQIYPKGTPLELVSVNGDGKYVKVKVQVTYAELTEKEKADLLILIEEATNDENMPDFLKTVRVVLTRDPPEMINEYMNALIRAYNFKLIRTTYHPFYIVYDDPLKCTGGIKLVPY